MLETGGVEVGAAQLDIDEMLLPGLLIPRLCAVAVRVPVLVRPGRGARDVVRGQRIGVCRQHRLDLGAHHGIEQMMAMIATIPMALVAPGGRGRRRAGTDQAEEQGADGAGDAAVLMGARLNLQTILPYAPQQIPING
jgi:hypothetical protein